MLKAEKEQRRRGEREKERRDDIDRRERERDEREFEHDSTRDINLHQFSNKRRAFRLATDQLHQDGEVEENFSTLPSSSSYDDKSTVKSEFYMLHLIDKPLVLELGRRIMFISNMKSLLYGYFFFCARNIMFWISLSHIKFVLK